MPKPALRFRVVSLITGVAILAFSGWASADPPARVARLGYMNGAVSFSPAGENDWDQATINRPLTSGDRLWTDAGARAEIQIGGAMVRMNAATGAAILNLDDQIAQLQLTEGTLNVRVRRLDPNQVFEVDTPNLAFTLRQPGEYRIAVDPDGNATTIVVRKGQGEAYGEGAAYTIDTQQAYRFSGTGLRDYQYADTPRPDEFDRWASDRDRRYDNSSSARYVSPDVVGYQDLDANGSWRDDASYGKVWIPNHMAADWAPYRDGHWAWVDPWGWTWVDDAPWGFAVSHYGRWANMRGTWGWVPGPVRSRAYYAPALVAFVGGSNLELNISSGRVGGVAWFPLAPREAYRPAYPVSRGYFEKINRSNTVINNTVINNTYINKTSNIVYANRQVPGAIVAVPTTTFVQSQPVGRAAQRIPRDRIASTAVAAAPTVAPTEKSVRGRAEAGGKPPSRVFERPVIARSAPPAAHTGFAAQQQHLAAQPGKPLDDAARKELKPAAAVPAPVVKVVAPMQEARPTARPPPPAAEARPGAARGKPDAPPAAAAPGVPGAPTPGSAAAQATPLAPAAESPRGRFEQRGRDAQRGQAIAPPPPVPAAPLRAGPPPASSSVPSGPATEQRGKPIVVPPAMPQAMPPQNVPPVPPAPSPEARGKPEQRGGAVVATPPPPTQRAVEPRVVPPQVTSPVPPAPSPEARARPEQRGPAVAPPPVQRAVEPRVVPPQVTSPVPPTPSPEARARPEQRGPAVAPPPPVQRPAETRVVPPQVTPPAPAQRREAPPAAAPMRPEPAANSRPPEPRPPVAAPLAPPPQAAPRGQEPRPDAGRPNERGGDKANREEENRKPEK